MSVFITFGFVGIARIHIRTAGMSTVFAAWAATKHKTLLGSLHGAGDHHPDLPGGNRWENAVLKLVQGAIGAITLAERRVFLPGKVNIAWTEDGRYGNYQITSFNTVNGKIPIGMGEYPSSTRRI